MFYAARTKGDRVEGQPMPEVYDWPLMERNEALRMGLIVERLDGPLDVGGLLSMMTAKQLQALAKSLEISHEGTQSELTERIIEAHKKLNTAPNVKTRSMDQCVAYWGSARAYLEDLARDKSPSIEEIDRIRRYRVSYMNDRDLEAHRQKRLDEARLRGARQTMDDRAKLLHHCEEYGVKTEGRSLEELIDELVVVAGYELPKGVEVAELSEDAEKFASPSEVIIGRAEA